MKYLTEAWVLCPNNIYTTCQGGLNSARRGDRAVFEKRDEGTEGGTDRRGKAIFLVRVGERGDRAVFDKRDEGTEGGTDRRGKAIFLVRVGERGDQPVFDKRDGGLRGGGGAGTIGEK